MIFVLDLITDDIQLHLLYLFPLVMIAFHSVQKSVVKTAVGVSLMFQGLTLAFENLPLYSKLTLAVLVTLTNILVVYISLIVRAYFLEVTKLSSFDGLTGLRNRISFESIIEMEISKEVRSGGVLSFAVINFDNLKEWNESKGYASGDSALKLLANILQENIRQTDTAARISGDEFAILMPHTDAAECESFSKKLSEIISFQMKNASIAVTASIGHATFSQPPASISEVFQKAENAMHAEQSSGLACIL
jgi:diguanylate cyclase (GGDEF)-like protein